MVKAKYDISKNMNFMDTMEEKKHHQLFTLCTTHYALKTNISLIRKKPRIYVP